MVQTIQETLNSFSNISLAELGNSSLQERTDTKFIFPESQLPGILSKLSPMYSLLKISDREINSYETLYFDNDDLQLYKEHHNNKGNRYKIRYRKYTESGTCFFEIKFKNNKGRTFKHRLPKPEIERIISGDAALFLQAHTPFLADNFAPRLTVCYSRITLVNFNAEERITFDLGLQAGVEGKDYTFGNIVVAELKQAKAGISPLKTLMKKTGVRESSISKYCLAMTFFQEGIKTNNFKETLSLIQKTAYAV
jgi:hypothetical protein